jgi:hypothetical protein
VTGETEPYRAWKTDFPRNDPSQLCVVFKKDSQQYENKKCTDNSRVLCEL